MGIRFRGFVLRIFGASRNARRDSFWGFWELPEMLDGIRLGIRLGFQKKGRGFTYETTNPGCCIADGILTGKQMLLVDKNSQRNNCENKITVLQWIFSGVAIHQFCSSPWYTWSTLGYHRNIREGNLVIPYLWFDWKIFESGKRFHWKMASSQSLKAE